MSPSVPRVFSGIQPTGEVHLGNYLGALRHWVTALDEATSPDESLYCVVDLHAMTLPYDADEFAERTRRTVMFLLAAGLDPEKYVKVDKELYRPAEVNLLLGDSSKARRVLGWKHEISFESLVHEMLTNDCERLSVKTALRSVAQG